jgi:RNA polymerase sigma-70 factor (ECF subfamily)
MDALPAESRRSAPSWDWGRVRRVCLRESTRVLGAGAAAEDAAQEALVRAWRQRHQCHDPSHPDPWLRRIALNEAMRQASRRTESALDELGEPAAVDPGPETGTDAYVRQLVNRLAPLDRRLLFMQHWADVPVHQIAVELRMPEGTVKIRLHRARARLRKMMEEDP